ncbi:DNA translocase FtsK 1-like isoform X2 [Pectinophora gossypiella]|uniref:DNA translocase FtsK 1-like isoform X2 n=1 Tax=Pectinophora gossypiella TaxID=13191 RepID=UPI00214ED17A|nr:DNA translocase FtsK 1-like isoform X2 [Pectinophora gossypiella]
MILTKIVAALICCLDSLNGAYGTSFSKVYVQSGADAGQFPYYNYGAPVVAYPSAQLSQLTAAPVGSVLPLPQVSNYATPCVQPCIPAQPVAPIPKAGLIAYKAAPVVVAKDEPPQPYEYSYVVFDEDTGDHKAQKELSNGVLVTGKYSFLQPDGFNAVVRNFLPENSVKTLVVPAAPPCDDSKPKSEAIKEAPGLTEAKSGEPSKKEESRSPGPASEKLPPRTPKSEQGGPKNPPATEGKKEQQKELPAPAPEKKPTQAADPRVEITQAEVREEKPPKLEGTAQRTEQPVVQPIVPPQLVPAVIDTNNPPSNYVSYDQLLNCLQAKQNQRINSPLTYILVPSKPC